VGACITINELRQIARARWPRLAELLRRFGSEQVRNAATIGGNIANGSPIGDAAPALIALGATVELRRKKARRALPLEDFFIDYGKQDRNPGEFVEAVRIPRPRGIFAAYKLSKRLDQDISAVMGAFHLDIRDGVVLGARIAFGGMAPVPKRARAVEETLAGQPWDEDTIRRARLAFAEDFSPISDMRATAAYRLEAARNMLTRLFVEAEAGRELVDIQAVGPIAGGPQ